MIGAEVIDGRQVESVLEPTLANERVSYLHIHFAGPGCYACRVGRVDRSEPRRHEDTKNPM
jgi:uncharacterized protein DUF1203